MVTSTDKNMSVRDLLQKAIEDYTTNKRIIEERQREVSVPKPEVAEQPESVAPKASTPTGRYQVNPNLFMDRETTLKEVNNYYEKYIGDKEVNDIEQGHLQATADYLNGNITAREYLDKLNALNPGGPGREEEEYVNSEERVNRVAQSMVDKYKKLLIDTEEGSSKSTESATPKTIEHEGKIAPEEEVK